MSYLVRRFKTFIWLGLPIIAVAGLFFGLRDGAAAWQAHRGEGVAGTFVATRAMCKVSSDKCSTIYGDFAATDGSVKRSDVVLYEAPESLSDGGEAAAQDTGAPHGVFLPDGGSSYVMYTVFTVGGALAAVVWLLLIVARVRRRKTAGPVNEGAAV